MSKAERESDRENILERKKRQRTEAYSRRRSLTEEERAAKSAAICHFLQEIPALRQAETVFSYAASAVEANLDEINQVLAEQGKRVCFPLCYSDGIMQAVLPALNDPQAWSRGAFGIREPILERSSVVDPEEIDVVLVPCVVFDERGGRCGHGKGYYDRFLEGISPNTPKILIAFDAQKTDEVAMEETDVRMDLVVTEKGITAIRK